MKLILNQNLILDDWCQLQDNPVRDWIRLTKHTKSLTYREHCKLDITRVYFYETVSNTFHYVFAGKLHFLNQVYRDIYGEELRKLGQASFFDHTQAEEAKNHIDDFMVRIFKIKSFI